MTDEEYTDEEHGAGIAVMILEELMDHRGMDEITLDPEGEDFVMVVHRVVTEEPEEDDAEE